MAAHSILMPKLGLTMTEGLIAEWRVGPGDAVREGQVIFAVETDKITSEVEARGGGRIEEIRVPVGATVPVGAVVATWTGPAQGVEESPLPGGEGDPTLERAEHPHPTLPLKREGFAQKGAGERIVATPYARKLAREAGVALDGLPGTGPHGRIKAADVEAALAAPLRGAVSAPAAILAFAEVDLSRLDQLCARLAEAGESLDRAALVERACARTGLAVAVEIASGRAWTMPHLREGHAVTLAIGPAAGRSRPVALASDPSLDAAALLDGIVTSLENPLRLLL